MIVQAVFIKVGQVTEYNISVEYQCGWYFINVLMVETDDL